MRPAILLFAITIALACTGCGQTYTFDEALTAGRISWEPVTNVEIRTKSGNTTTVQAVEFTTKLKYDSTGRASPDTAGQKTYKWSGKEATFGPGAVIRLTKGVTVREGALRRGAEWTWDGTKWYRLLAPGQQMLPGGHVQIACPRPTNVTGEPGGHVQTGHLHRTNKCYLRCGTVMYRLLVPDQQMLPGGMQTGGSECVPFWQGGASTALSCGSR